MNNLLNKTLRNVFAGSMLLLLATVNKSSAQNTFPASGNVGIGTTSPAAHLDINSGYTAPYSTVGYTYDANNMTSLRIINSDAPVLVRPPLGVIYVPGNTADIISVFKRSNNGSFADRKLLAMTADGKVRIGERAANGAYANYKLSVDGDMIARRCVIQVTNWADYVFAPDYALPSLNDVEVFIKQNKHLPGVPSEAEVKENGIEVGDMNKVLLQKVEELTLYIIELKKEVETLKTAR